MAIVPNIFPQGEDDDVLDDFDPDDSIGLVDTGSDDPLPYGFTWTYDFNNEDLDFSRGNPTKVRDLGVVNEWITHVVNIERFETPIYGNDLGTDIFKLIGNTLDPYVMSRVNQEISKSVSIHDRVVEVTFITSFSAKGNIYTYFTYLTDDSSEGQSLTQLR